MQVIAPQNNRPVMSFIQDTLVGAYLITSPTATDILKEDMMHYAMAMPGWEGKFEHKDRYTGKDLISMTLPYVNYERHGVKIVRGKLLKGQLNKKSLGSSHGSLIHVIHNDCGPEQTLLFIHRLQSVCHQWLITNGFSIGISDMLNQEQEQMKVNEERMKAYNDIEGVEEEVKINERLNICRDSMGKMVQEPLDERNRLYCCVNSGSKGNHLNISQILGCVGQQNLSGGRIPYTWNKRTLPHFKRGAYGPKERGFVAHSYVEGLKPWEVFFHAISGREGLIDTACKTSTTGYLQRRFMKALENLKVELDGSVRNADGSIFQFKYGDDGVCATKVEKQRIPTFKKPSPRGLLTEEYEQLLKDHAFLQEVDKCIDPTIRGTGYFMLPIPVERIIDNAKKLFAFPSARCSAITFIKRVKELTDGIDNELLCVLIRSYLNTNTMQGVTDDQLDIIIKGIKDAYQLMRADAGESVGAIAAQSLGEPATQMTLNTFHFAGISSKNVTLGIPRLEECINVSKNLKTPLTTVNLQSKEESIDVLKQIKHVQVKDIVTRHLITSTPDKSQVEEFFIFPDEQYKPPLANCETLVLELNDWNKIEKIRDLIYAHPHLYCAYSDSPYAVFHIHTDNKEIDLDMFYMKTFRHLTVAGVASGEYANVIVKGQTYTFETSLTDLEKVFYVVEKVADVYTNDVWRIYCTLGIEAARSAYLIEIRNILAFYGIYVNVRHILLVIDWMTHIGTPTPFTRHGIRNVDESPLKRGTFEEVVSVFTDAAVYNETDNLHGVSERIIAGLAPKIGTASTEIILDKEAENTNKVAPPVKKSKRSSISWTEDENPWLTERPTSSTANPWGDEPQQQTFNSFVPTGLFGVNNNAWQQQPMNGMGMGGMMGSFGPMGGMMGNSMGGMMGNSMGGMMGSFGSISGSMGGMPFGVGQLNPSQQLVNHPMGNVSPQAPGYDEPTTPDYDPYNPPDSPMSPAYSPQSPAYSPTSPAYSPTSPHSPQSPAYSPTSPAYSPTSPAYSPTSPAYNPTSPTYDPYTPTETIHDNVMDMPTLELGQAALEGQDTQGQSYHSSLRDSRNPKKSRS